MLCSFAEKRKLGIDHSWGKLGEEHTDSLVYFCFSCPQSPYAEIGIHDIDIAIGIHGIHINVHYLYNSQHEFILLKTLPLTMRFTRLNIASYCRILA